MAFWNKQGSVERKLKNVEEDISKFSKRMKAATDPDEKSELEQKIKKLRDKKANLIEAQQRLTIKAARQARGKE